MAMIRIARVRLKHMTNFGTRLAIVVIENGEKQTALFDAYYIGGSIEWVRY